MADYTGGPDDDTFFLSSVDGSSTVDGRGGVDFLSVNWSDKAGAFGARFGDREAHLTDGSGVTIDAVNVERFRVVFSDVSDAFDMPEIDWSFMTAAAEVTIDGTAQEARFVGNGGSRQIDLVGADYIVLTLGSGDDRVTYRNGGGRFDGGGGTDTLHADLRAWTGGVTVHLNRADDGRYTIVGNTRIIGFERFEVVLGPGGDLVSGGELGDFFSAGAGADLISGAGGADVIHGGAGNDLLDGGGGGDQIFGGEGIDTVFYTYGRAGVTVDLRIRTAQDTIGSGSDLIRGVENATGTQFHDSLTGNGRANRLNGLDGDDRLVGAGGADVLIGGEGDDRLIGSAGTDELTGGAGADLFVFDASASTSDLTADIVTDFSREDGDRIDLRKVDADVSDSRDQRFTLIGDTAFTGTAGELRFDLTGTGILVQGDTDGDGAADVFIRIEGTTDLVAADLIL